VQRVHCCDGFVGEGVLSSGWWADIPPRVVSFFQRNSVPSGTPASRASTDTGLAFGCSIFWTSFVLNVSLYTVTMVSLPPGLGRGGAQAASGMRQLPWHRGGTVRLVPGSGPTIPGMTERVGESIGLSVVNRIHGLHEADWDKIPSHSGKGGFPTFDFETAIHQSASDGKDVIQVEAKGAAGEDSAKLAATVRTQARKAKEKKREIAEQEPSGQYRYPASVRYATVTAIGADGPATCFLLDPPAEESRNPAVVRLINRIRYLADLVSFISPRSQLASAARTRLQAISNLNDPMELAGVPLVRGNGRYFELERFDDVARRHGYFRNMSHVIDSPVGGVASQTPRGDILFVGIREELVGMLMQQDFDKIQTYRMSSGSVSKEVECLFTPARARELDIPDGIDPDVKDAQVRLRVKGTLRYSPGGIVFGVLPLRSVARIRRRRSG
jgi:hypothetical protein